MAARLNPRNDDEARAKIQTTQLINLLMDHALNGRKVKVSQLRAAETLLRKTLPDLSAVAHSGSIETKDADQYSDAYLASVAAGGSQRAPEQETGQPLAS